MKFQNKIVGFQFLQKPITTAKRRERERESSETYRLKVVLRVISITCNERILVEFDSQN